MTESQLNRLLGEKLAGLACDDLTRRLLWLAKSGQINGSTYDDAWDAWEGEESKKIDPAWYRPTDELAGWMRDHWDEFDSFADPLKSAPTLPTAKIEAAVSEIKRTVSAAAAIRSSPAVHFETCCHITMKDNMARRPVCNVTQAMIFGAYHALRRLGAPIKIIIIKARQLGASEGSAEVCYHHSRAFNLAGFLMADTADRTDKIWTLFCRHIADDAFEKGWGNRITANTEKAVLKFRNQAGKLQEVEWNRGTAGDTGAGSAGTRQILWLSESARYAKDGAYKDSTVIGNALNSVPDSPLTLVIAESTAEGARNCWHGQTYDGAVTLDERLSGKIGNGWVKIFIGWHQADDYQLEPARAENAEFFDDQDARWESWRDDEEAGRMRYGWTPAQIAWRRKKIVGDLSGDVQMFRRDYPSSADEAWATAGAKRFHQVAVARLMQRAEFLWDRTIKGMDGAPVLGWLVDQGGDTRPDFFRGRGDDCWLWVAEPPTVGYRYELVIDPMGMEQTVDGQSDSSAIGVLRAAVSMPDGQVKSARLVATIHVPGGCKWEYYLTVDRVVSLARWYGGAIVVQEVNKIEGMVRDLRARGMKIWQREMRPSGNQTSNRIRKDGYLTTQQTRNHWVAKLAEALSEDAIECEYLPAVRELDTFIVDKHGRAEAAAGFHDDWVAMLGIGVSTIDSATPYTLPTVRTQPRQFEQRSTPYGSGAIG